MRQVQLTVAQRVYKSSFAQKMLFGVPTILSVRDAASQAACPITLLKIVFIGEARTTTQVRRIECRLRMS